MALRGAEWATLWLGHLTPDKALNWMLSWPHSCMDVSEGRKVSFLFRDCQAQSLVTVQTTPNRRKTSELFN